MVNRGANQKITEAVNCSKGKEKVKILFVCLGNICRSPAAEGVARSYAEERGREAEFEFDSAGTYGGHAGELPDPRMRAHAVRRGLHLTHRSRQVKESDFEEFDLIVAMDDSNYHNLRCLAPTLEGENKVVRMISYCRRHPWLHSVPDPYYEGAEGFELVLDMLEDGCSNLIDGISAE